MRKALKLFAVIALVAVIGFSFAACDTGGDNSGGGDGWLGNTITITDAQVYSFERDTSAQYVKFTGTVQDLKYIFFYNYDDDDHYRIYQPLSDFIDGNPSVTLKNGILNMTIGKPKNSSLLNLGDMPSGITVSTTNVKYFSIDSIYDQSIINSDTYNVSQGKLDGTQISYVLYFYVDKDVNITGKFADIDDGYTYINNYAMNLKAGWNSVIITEKQTETYTYQRTYKTGTPPAGFHWVISQGEGGNSGGGGGSSGGSDDGR